MRGGAISSKLGPLAGAICLALVMSMGLLFIQSSSAADSDDQSYLPPWMRHEANAVKEGEKADPPVEKAQQAKAEARPEGVKEPHSAGLAAKATEVRKKVVGFVSDLFKRSIHFAGGE